MKIIFLPFSIAVGLIAGLISKKVFNELWALVDHEEPPDSRHRDIQWGKLLAAAAIQGAIFRAVKEGTDHAGRRAFAGVTGSWPGPERPEPE